MSLHDYSTRYEKLVEKLKQARVNAGLTQTEVAKHLRKGQHFVSRIETGQRRIDVIELQELAKIYNLPISFFLNDTCN